MKKQRVAIGGNDKKLLIILLAIVIAFFIYNYIISPQLDIGSDLKAEKNHIDQELNRAKIVVADLPLLEKEEKQKKDELIERYEPFFYELNEEDLLAKLSSLINEAGLPVTSYTPSAPVISSINIPTSDYAPMEYPLLDLAGESNQELKEEEKSESEGNKNTDSSDVIPAVDITFDINGASYSSVMNFIERIEEMQKTILIKNISLTKTEAGLNGNIIISVYSLPKLDQSQMDEFQFSPTIPKGKEDPFM